MAGRFSVEAVFKAVDKMTAPVSRMQNRFGKFTRAIGRGIEGANRAVGKFVSGLATAGKSVIKFGTAGVGALTASVGLLVREFSKVEDAEAAFTPLLGGAERARMAVEALNEAAASTPFQFETLASAANQLLPVMNGNIQDTVKTLRMLGDTAGGNAQKLDSITRGFTKAMLKGKVDMESLNMIAEAGVPIFGDLAEVMGTEVNGAFFKMISAGKVTTVQLTKAFEKMTGKGGMFFEGMEIASKTTSGLFSTLKDNISLTAAELGSVLAPTVKDLIRGATDIAKRVREWVKNNRELISEKFIRFVETAKSAVMGFIKTLQDFNRETSILQSIGEIITAIAGVFRFLGQHGGTILKITAAVVGLSLALKTLSVVMTAVNLAMTLSPIGLIVAGVVAAVAAFSALYVWAEDILEVFEDMNPILRLILAPIEAIVRAIKFIKDGVTGGFGNAFAALGRSIFGGDDEDAAAATATDVPAVVSPQERAAKIIEERRQTSAAEVTIRDETGRAEVTSGEMGPGLTLAQSGTF